MGWWNRWAMAGLLVPLLAAAPVRADQVLQVGNGDEPGTLDPQKSLDVPGGRILFSLCEGLVGMDAAGRPIPGAAEHWHISADGRTWVFTLRAGARWSDGRAMSAEDWVWSWRRAVTPAIRVGLPEVLAPIRHAEAIMAGRLPPDMLGVRALDARTLEVELERNSPEFLYNMSERAAMPVPRHVIEVKGDAWTRPGTMVCNGPFTLTEQVPHAYVRAVRNPYFHDAASVALDAVVWHASEDNQTELKRFRTGELHVTDTVPSAQLDWTRDHLAQALRVAPYAATVFLVPNLTREPWASSPGLRRALALAIDRDMLVSRITRAGERPAYTLVPPGLGGIAGGPDWAAWPQERRDAEARRLMRDAGYGPERPLSLELTYNGNDTNDRIVVAVAAMWQAKLGVQTVFRAEDLKQQVARMRSRNWTDLIRISWAWNRARGYLAPMLPGASNWNGYDSPAFRTAMLQADMARDEKAYAALLGTAQLTALADMPVIPLYHQTSRHLVSPRVRGWTDNVIDLHLPRWLSLADQ